MPIPSKPWPPPRPSHIRESAWKKIQSIKGDDLPKDREFLVRRKTRSGACVIALQRWCQAGSEWLAVIPQESNVNPGYADLGEPLRSPEYTEWCEVPS